MGHKRRKKKTQKSIYIICINGEMCSKQQEKCSHDSKKRGIAKVILDLDLKLGQYFEKKATGQILAAIILAFAVAGANLLGGLLVRDKKIDSFVNEIAIGESEASFLENLGTPQFSSEKKIKSSYLYGFDENEKINIKEDIFITKNYIVNAYFHQSHLCGFFITLRNKRHRNYHGGAIYKEFVGKEPLGKATFMKTEEDLFEPRLGDFFVDRYGYCYIEDTSLITCGIGNGYDVIQAYVDYGFTSIVPLSVEEASMWLPSSIYFRDTNTNPEGGYLVLLNRKLSYPNTFGVIEDSLSDSIVQDMNSIVDAWDISAYRIWWNNPKKGEKLFDSLMECNITLLLD